MTHITLPYPPSANRYWRHYRNQVVRSAEADEYKLAAYWAIREQMGQPPEPITGPIKVTLKLYRPRMSGDLDNRVKITLDSIQGSLIVDDSQVVELHAYRLDDKSNPRVEVSIHQV